MGVRANEERLRLTNISDFHDPSYKASALTTNGVTSTNLCHKSSKPPLIPHNIVKEEDNKDDPSDSEVLDSEFITSKTSLNDMSDMDEHSGLKKLEQHLGTFDEFDAPLPTYENIVTEKGQHVTQISSYQEDEVIDSCSQPMKAANTSIRSRMLEEYRLE